MNRLTFSICIPLVFLAFSMPSHASDTSEDWLDALEKEREGLLAVKKEKRPEIVVEIFRRLERAYPVFTDWLLQDGFEDGLWTIMPAGGRNDFRTQSVLTGDRLSSLLIDMNSEFWRRMLFRVITDMKKQIRIFPEEFEAWMLRSDVQSVPEMVALYLRACELRREHRLEPLRAQEWEGIVFAQHYNMGASHYAYTEGLSDAQRERHFYPGSALTLLRKEGTRFVPESLIEDKNGVIRDVDVSWDGSQILFAWKKSDFEDDYSLYEMDADTREIKAITGELGHADYEPAYLPNGDIVFNSTRCVQIVDCWWTEVSNLYTCAADGRYLRRLAFDQVHDNYPAVTEDGRVLYTRWDYNDRGQIYPQGLFEMLPDGTAQREFYGNNSWFPTTILHARGIPGTQKAMAVFTGHHTFQAGKLGILDPAHGRQENDGAQLIAPLRDTPAEKIDRYGQEGDLFKYPYPIDEKHFLVSYAPRGWKAQGIAKQIHDPVFGLYFMDIDGQRELLYMDTDRKYSVGRMVPLAARSAPVLRPSAVDYSKDTGVYYIQDIYEGPGLKEVPRGTVKALRVVGLEFRAVGIGDNRSNGVAGGALISTPIAIGNGSWDVKIPLGDATIYADGSAMFSVPARMPVYFQALDENGRALQSMRSWSTLQPGETQSCVGCHEQTNMTPLAQASTTLAMQEGVQSLDEAYGTPRGFSFPERIQPMLDRHCIKCHYGDHTPAEIEEDSKHAFSLLGTAQLDDQAKRYWSESYLALTKGGPEEGPVRWISAQSAPPMYPPYHTGAVRSPVVEELTKGHNGVQLSEDEMRLLSCWIDLGVPFCGDYEEANAWNDEEKAKHEHFMRKRDTMKNLERKNTEEYMQDRY